MWRRCSHRSSVRLVSGGGEWGGDPSARGFWFLLFVALPSNSSFVCTCSPCPFSWFSIRVLNLLLRGARVQSSPSIVVLIR